MLRSDVELCTISFVSRVFICLISLNDYNMGISWLDASENDTVDGMVLRVIVMVLKGVKIPWGTRDTGHVVSGKMA